MFSLSVLQDSIISFTNYSWNLDLCVGRCCSQASYWALYHWRQSQHSASHLSDRCLPPKQWVIALLHLSGCTHLVWCAAFLLLFLVMAWHPQSAYQPPFFGYGTWMLCLCLAVCLFQFLCYFLFYFWFLSMFHFFSVPRYPLPQSDEVADYVREKGKEVFFHLESKERSNLSLSVLVSWMNV